MTTQLLRVQNFLLSADGFGSGEGQSFEHPFGHANPADLGAWAFGTASWPNRTDGGGSRGFDDYFTRDDARNIGAEIMGRNKFGWQRGPWENHVPLHQRHSGGSVATGEGGGRWERRATRRRSERRAAVP